MKNRTLTVAGIGAAAAAATKHYAGKNEMTPYGSVQVTITVKNRKIKTLAVSARPDTPNSYQLEAYALPVMRKEALKASSYRIHLVSGVTITSEAFDASLYSAMGHAHLL